MVIVNIFYEKFMEIQISGDKFERIGKKDSDIYLNIFGKKIYFKKVINCFEFYDKIEEKNGIFNKVIYFEKKGKFVNVDKESVIKEVLDKLKELLGKILSNNVKIIDNKVIVEDVGEGKILV